MPGATKIHTASYEKALRDSPYEIGDEEVATLAKAEAERGPLQNWPRSAFSEVLGNLKGLASFEVVRGVKMGATDDEPKAADLPERAPYLTYDAKGHAKDYDPHDGTQFYTDPDTAELYRWDGKGKVHRVVQVSHSKFGGVLLPNEDDALAAIDSGAHWFHAGLGVWIGFGGKQLAEVSRDTRDKVAVALAQRERSYENDGSRPFLSRMPVMAN